MQDERRIDCAKGHATSHLLPTYVHVHTDPFRALIVNARLDRWSLKNEDCTTLLRVYVTYKKQDFFFFFFLFENNATAFIARLYSAWSLKVFFFFFFFLNGFFFKWYNFFFKWYN